MGPRLLLGPLLRYVDERSATVWVETDRSGRVEILGRTTDTFTAFGHHYALVVIEGLEPATATEYEVHLDGSRVWPLEGTDLPPSVIRTPTAGEPIDIAVGSCRAAAPHERPYVLERAFDPEGRGVDALWALANRMVDQDPSAWPDLLILAGDQIYADDSSPTARARIEARRGENDELPPAVVADYEEYCWLYREAWSQTLERWLLSVVPTAMIIDDHDMIDDWNISARWLADIRGRPWWSDHIVGGLASYWVHQHLGNLSPRELAEDPLFARVTAQDDATDTLCAWARDRAADMGTGDGEHFGFRRTVGDVDLVVVDSRAARVLDPGRRAMLDDATLRWFEDACRASRHHLLVVTSLPIFVPDGLHDLQAWNERVCDGAWGAVAARLGERIRQTLDLEDWAAFSRSYRRVSEVLSERAQAGDGPRTVTVASGDIHFGFIGRVEVDGGEVIHQVVSSPLRNALIPPARSVLRLSLTRPMAAVLRVLARLARTDLPPPGMAIDAEPVFSNNVASIRTGTRLVVELERAALSDDDDAVLEPVVRRVL